MHFQDRIADGRMVFDYRMQPGVVEHSNALALMRAVGLEV
jgi:DNA mismatch repair ATPase MutS